MQLPGGRARLDTLGRAASTPCSRPRRVLVDAQVAHHLLHNCILSGPLESRTRVMVTHQLEVLERADWVVVMDRVQDVGRIVQQGTYRVGLVQLQVQRGGEEVLIGAAGSAKPARTAARSAARIRPCTIFILTFFLIRATRPDKREEILNAIYSVVRGETYRDASPRPSQP
jgi:ABC-type methionine transport system ATPase subunit